MDDDEGLRRLEAVREAVQYYRNKYADDESGFELSKHVKFCYESARGIHLKATSYIPAGDTIIAMPNQARICYDATLDPEIVIGEEYNLAGILDGFFNVCLQLQFSGALPYIRPKDVCTSFLVMYLLKNGNTTRFEKAIATWPSRETITATFPTNNPELLEGTFAGLMSKINIEHDKKAFEIVFPILEQDNLKRFFVRDDENPWECYYYASRLVQSRSHKEGGLLPKTDAIWPLIEHINGLPDCAHVNVKQRPNDSHFVLAAARDINPGEELFLTYGWSEASHFVMGYGVLPKQVCQDGTYSSDYICFEVSEIGDSDFDRKSALSFCQCHPFEERYFLFPPRVLDDWKMTPKTFHGAFET